VLNCVSIRVAAISSVHVNSASFDAGHFTLRDIFTYPDQSVLSLRRVVVVQTFLALVLGRSVGSEDLRTIGWEN